MIAIRRHYKAKLKELRDGQALIASTRKAPGPVCAVVLVHGT